VAHSQKVASVINDPHLLSREQSVDLSRLNDTERRVLRLLAEGHTAKSIANTTGSTPAAVNERLREARRKTGVGSSRELARLLRAQENRHELIGVGRAPSAGATLLQPDADPWRPQMGVVAMIALFTVAVAGAAALMTEASPSITNDVDPLIGSPLEHAPDIATLHEKVRSEARDKPWAERMETAIRARVIQIPLVGKGSNALRVICASSQCEIAGTLIAPKNKAELEDPKSQWSRTFRALQVPPLPDDLAKIGLKFEAATFTSSKGKPDRSVFLLYYSRSNTGGRH
jgi:DNA-binding CsgD family transcriptional regulator